MTGNATKAARKTEEEKEKRRKEIAREWTTRKWKSIYKKALDEHLGFYSVRTGLRREFFFPRLRSKPGKKIATAELIDKDDRVLIFLAKTLFHIGRTGKLTIPKSSRPKQPF